MSAPLLDVFLALRRRGLPLGVGEYLAGLRALAAGFGTGPRDELLWLCQALWAKSPDQARLVAEALDDALPRPPAAKGLDRPAEALENAAARQPDRALPPEDPAPGAGALRLVAEGAARLAAKAWSLFPGFGTLPAGTEAPAMTRPPAPAPPVDAARFTFAGRPPVEMRHLNRAWRYVRRMQRSGAAVELDADATADRFCRDGVLVAPVFVPRRRNQAAVTVLLDQGGSMVPFRPLTQALLDSAGHGGLARTDVLYFHDVPADPLFRDPALCRPLPPAEALRPFAGGGVLVVGDAGAARGGRDPARAARTRAALAALRALVPRVAWLNPVPRSRWDGTTAELIRGPGGVPMFPLDERAGVDAAMDVLRGRRRS